LSSYEHGRDRRMRCVVTVVVQGLGRPPRWPRCVAASVDTVASVADRSAIEWTEATWNPVTGCSKVSPGCAHCYAETFAERFRGVPGHPYEQGFDLRL